MTFALGSELVGGKYRLDAHLGQGAFGDVYRATHVELRAPRALKVLRHDAPGVGSSDYGRARERFRLEAQLGAQLKTMRAPHVIEVYDFEEIEGVAQGVAHGAAPGALVLVMEYAPGGSLADRMVGARQQGEPLSVDEGVRIAREVAAGLAALHALDAVHRDVKPSNILFDAKGRVLLADFGLAQVPGGQSDRTMHSQGVAHPGTPAYMSPEQRVTGDYLTPASDIYALGAVLFEMLTGRVWRSMRPGTEARGLRAEVPEWVNALVMRCLAPEPEGRPWDGAEFVDAVVEGGSEATARRRAQEAAALAEAAQREEEQERQRREVEAAAREAVVALERRRRAAAERSKRGLLTLAPGVEMALVEVPAGVFLMGSDPKRDSRALGDEQPQREVYLSRYWIGKAPVTNVQFAAFVAATRHRTTVEREGQSYVWREGWVKLKGADWRHPRGPESRAVEDHPVVHVSWEDAVAFCTWVTGLGQGVVRLPTEAEWEKAARGMDGRIWAWGDQGPTPELCNFSRNVGDTTPVERYSPGGDSPYGCVDMAGNVWEWCADWYGEDYYSHAPAHDPQGPESGTSRVLRGGSWINYVRYVRPALRFRDNPLLTYFNYGFRCVFPRSP